MTDEPKSDPPEREPSAPPEAAGDGPVDAAEAPSEPIAAAVVDEPPPSPKPSPPTHRPVQRPMGIAGVLGLSFIGLSLAAAVVSLFFSAGSVLWVWTSGLGVGTALFLADRSDRRGTPLAGSLRVGWPAPLHVVVSLLYIGLGPLLWHLRELHDAARWDDPAGPSWVLSEVVSLVFAAAATLLLSSAWLLQRRIAKIAPGTPGRARLGVAVWASIVLVLAQLALALVIVASRGTAASFDLDLLGFNEQPAIVTWWETLETIAIGQGTYDVLRVSAVIAGVATLTHFFTAIAAWFLAPARVRVATWLTIDFAVFCAFVFALYALPFTPRNDDDVTQPSIALAIATLFGIRALSRLMPSVLDTIERTGIQPMLAARMLRARKSGFLTVIGGLSILAVSFSSCTLTVTLSVMGGFRADLRDKILGNSAHVVVDREYGTWDGWDPVLARVREVPGVTGASPYVEGEVMITSASNLGGGMLRGIDPETVVTDLPRNLRHGRMDYLLHPARLLHLDPEEMTGSLLERMGGSDVEIDELDEIFDDDDEPDEEPVVPDAGPPFSSADAGPFVPGRRAVVDPVGLTDDIDELIAAIDRATGSGPVSAPLPEPVPDAADPSAADRERTVDEIADFLAPSVLREREDERDVLPGLIVGAELARSLRLHVGDEVNVVSPNGDLGPAGPMPRSRPFRVAGVFYSGMFEYDAQLVYTDLATAQRFLGVGSAITGLQIRTDDWERADVIAAEVAGATLRSELRVRSWQEVNRNLFGALQLEKLAMFLMLLIAVLVASFCVVGTLTLMVQEKGKEVGILKAMGAHDGQIVAVFLLQGLFIGLFGSLSGLALGYVACFAAEHFGVGMNPEVYYIDRLPVHVDGVEFTLVGISAVIVCVLATIYPAILGSRLRPIDALRHG